MTEGRLKYLSQRAAAGTITRIERDEIISLIAQSLWGMDERIERMHRRLCDQCELKKKHRIAAGLCKAVEGNKLPWIIIALLLAIIATLIGVDLSPLAEVIK